MDFLHRSIGNNGGDFLEGDVLEKRSCCCEKYDCAEYLAFGFVRTAECGKEGRDVPVLMKPIALLRSETGTRDCTTAKPAVKKDPIPMPSKEV